MLNNNNKKSTKLMIMVLEKKVTCKIPLLRCNKQSANIIMHLNFGHNYLWKYIHKAVPLYI